MPDHARGIDIGMPSQDLAREPRHERDLSVRVSAVAAGRLLLARRHRGRRSRDRAFRSRAVRLVHDLDADRLVVQRESALPLALACVPGPARLGHEPIHARLGRRIAGRRDQVMRADASSRSRIGEDRQGARVGTVGEVQHQEAHAIVLVRRRVLDHGHGRAAPGQREPEQRSPDAHRPGAVRSEHRPTLATNR
jgi:hypothetical protein